MKYLLPVFFLLVSFNATAETQRLDCEDPQTTVEMNQCAMKDLKAAEAVLERYFQASLENNSEDESLMAAIESSQQAWLGYREAQCGAVLTQWRFGTIAGVMTLSCKLEMTQLRTRELWHTFLTTMEGTSLLPDPASLLPDSASLLPDSASEWPETEPDSQH